MKKVYKNYFKKSFVVGILAALLSISAFSQESVKLDSTVLQQADLKQLIDYALKNQPLLKQNKLDEEITESTIKSKLADWYPQLNFNYSLQHNFIVQTSIIGGNPVKLGVENTSGANFALSQVLFNRDVLLAKRSQGDVRQQILQQTESNKINIVANVSKAYYNVLANIQQIDVTNEAINRLQKSLDNAKAQYEEGVADKTDYKRTSIQLNNAKAQKKSFENMQLANIELLKQLMGYPEEQPLTVAFEKDALIKEANLDTTATADYKNRIEFKSLETQRSLLKANVDYNRWSYLPTVSLNGNYNLNYLNNQFKDLYSNNFPNSFANLNVALPIFQGFKRKYNTKNAELQLKRTDWDLIALKQSVNAQYSQALETYKSNLANYNALVENVDLAKEVYDLIQLQYKSGIKTYIEVVTAEADLRTAEINSINALYQVLSSKVDVEKALGNIKTN
ncbi:TolC family protein [Polluticaenibacter yanchengensis]|uniref:TolC family protein n=1 Tax=Polluticaenibacter yanchengensis TaxID=3014562 RepID=A0ABT4UJ36_9BACT|nr:TolC family protein [Chitinophagaceae bacterium LY-5]